MNGDRILALIARNHDLLRVAAETRRQTLRLAVEASAETTGAEGFGGREESGRASEGGGGTR